MATLNPKPIKMCVLWSCKQASVVRDIHSVRSDICDSYDVKFLIASYLSMAMNCVSHLISMVELSCSGRDGSITTGPSLEDTYKFMRDQYSCCYPML